MKLAVCKITVMVDRNSEEKLKVLQHRFNLLGVDCSSEEFSKFTMPKILNKRGNDRSTNLFINGPVNAMCVNVLIRIFIQFQEVTLNCPYVQMELTLKSLE